MKYILAFVFLLCVSNLFAADALKQEDLEMAAQLRDKALQSQLAYEILESLITEVGSRMAGSDGDARAVAWAEAKFKELGFDKVWKEPVTFPTWKRGEEHGEIISPYAQKVHLTALGNSIGTGAQGIQGEIVHFATFHDLQKAKTDEVSGKIVFISHKMSKSRDASTYGAAVAARSQGASVAGSMGAKALVIRSIGTDNNRLPHTGYMRYTEGITKIPAAALSNPDADLLVNQLKRGEEVILRITLTPTAGPEATSYNVMGEIQGSEKPEEIIIIGGHLDSWDLGPGAVDDGAGVAITMAGAKLIAAGKHPHRTIRVILWANEEQGLFGAEAYAKAHAHEISRHIVGAESDLGAAPIWSFDWKSNNEHEPVIEQMAQLLQPLGIAKGENNAHGGADLIPLRQLGMSVFALNQDATDYFDIHHTANDTLDKVNPEHLAQNVAAYVVFAYAAAQVAGDFGFEHKYKY